MSAPAVPLTNTGPGYTIVTHVISPESATSQTGQNPPNNSPLQHFLKGEPKALGTFQQVIFLLGLITIIFGIILTFYLHSIVTIYNGSFYWASFLYITAGALAGSARFKFNKCKVTFSLVMNVLSAITAGLAVILLSVDFTLWWPECPNYGNHEYDSNYRCTYLGLSKGIRGVLLVCTIGHLIVSICISAYSCKVSCGNEPVVNVTVVANPWRIQLSG